MLSAKNKREIESLLKHPNDPFRAEELPWMLAYHVSSENVDELVALIADRLPREEVERTIRCIHDNDCLRPEDSAYEVMSPEYHQAVRRLLLDDELYGILAQVVCLPSFQPEWALHVMRAPDGRCRARLARAEKQIWPNAFKSEVTVSERPLSSDLAEQLEVIWEWVLLQTRYPCKHHGGLDGTTYHFQTFSMKSGTLCGQTWSPVPHTTPGKLVKLCHRLYDFVQSPATHEQAIRAASAWFAQRPG
jgi:hypothetical protein